MSFAEIFGSVNAETLNCSPHNLPSLTDVSSKVKVGILEFFALYSIFSRVSVFNDLDKTISFDLEIEFKTCFVPKMH